MGFNNTMSLGLNGGLAAAASPSQSLSPFGAVTPAPADQEIRDLLARAFGETDHNVPVFRDGGWYTQRGEYIGPSLASFSTFTVQQLREGWTAAEIRNGQQGPRNRTETWLTDQNGQNVDRYRIALSAAQGGGFGYQAVAGLKLLEHRLVIPIDGNGNTAGGATEYLNPELEVGASEVWRPDFGVQIVKTIFPQTFTRITTEGSRGVVQREGEGRTDEGSVRPPAPPAPPPPPPPPPGSGSRGSDGNTGAKSQALIDRVKSEANDPIASMGLSRPEPAETIVQSRAATAMAAIAAQNDESDNSWIVLAAVFVAGLWLVSRFGGE